MIQGPKKGQKKNLDIVATLEYIDSVKGNKKNLFMQIRISQAELKMVTQQAEKLGLTISAYIRMFIHREKEKSV